MADRYFLVSTDLTDKVIKDSFWWDGVTKLNVPDGQRVIAARDAAGYTQPVRTDLRSHSEINADTLRERASAALDANRAFLAIPAPGPTNAQVVGQVQRLTRECSAMIRLELNATDTTDGT